MKCPRLVFFRQFPGAEEQPEMGDCIKRECAWWYESTQSCEVSRIASNLSTIANALTALLERLPPEGYYPR